MDSTPSAHRPTRSVSFTLLLALGALSPCLMPPLTAQDVEEVRVSWATMDSLCKTAPGSHPDINRLCSVPSADWNTLAIPRPGDIRSIIAREKPIKRFLLKDTAASWLPAIDQSAILFGLTDFVVGRIRGDIQALGLERFYDRVCTVQPQFLQHTCDVLKPFVEGSLLPATSALKEAVVLDLRELPRTIVTKYAAEVNGNGQSKAREREISLLAVAATHAIYAVAEGQTFVRALASVQTALPPSKWKVDCTTTRVTAATYQLAAFAQLLLDGAPFPVQSGSADGAAELRELFLNNLRALIVNAQWVYREWPSGGSCEAGNHVGTRLPDVVAFAGVVDRLAIAYNDLLVSQPQATALAYLRSSDDHQADKVERATKVAGAIFDVLDPLARVYVAEDDRQTVLDALQLVRATTLSLLQGNYGAATVSILSFAADSARETKLGLPAGVKAASKYVLAATDIAQAKDAQSVTDALNRIAAPRTGFLRKRKDAAYIAVNAYGGAIYGRERAEDNGSTQSFAGFYLPVGVEAGFSIHKKLSLGVFVQAIDLGALASYRLHKSDDVSTEPKVGFKQVLSPGASVVAGWGKIPVTLGLLVISASPSLREIHPDGQAASASTVVRKFSLFAAFDVPLF